MIWTGINLQIYTSTVFSCNLRMYVRMYLSGFCWDMTSGSYVPKYTVIVYPICRASHLAIYLTTIKLYLYIRNYMFWACITWGSYMQRLSMDKWNHKFMIMVWLVPHCGRPTNLNLFYTYWDCIEYDLSIETCKEGQAC